LMRKYLEYADFFSSGASIFVTDAKFVGLMPRTASTGDFLAIVPGTDLLLVLRPAGPAWKFCGFAYLHCEAYGELWGGDVWGETDSISKEYLWLC
jgi:hypothetical protein